MALPSGVSNVELQYIPEKRDENGNILPIASKDFRAMGISSKVKYIYRYEDDILRETVIVRARYINTRNQTGPWSHSITITLI